MIWIEPIFSERFVFGVRFILNLKEQLKPQLKLRHSDLNFIDLYIAVSEKTNEEEEEENETDEA
jgi:hypothetical protein